jgi:hypothetical protein
MLIKTPKTLTHRTTKQKLSFLMTLLMSVSVFGTSTNVSATTESSQATNSQQKARRFSAVIEASGRKGKRSIGELDAMIPVFESESTLGLLDVKTKLDNDKSKEINIGAAVRHNFNDSVIFGLYTYFDHRKTKNKFSVSGATIGVEALTRYLDARANFYIAQDKKKKIAHDNKNQIEFKGKSVYTVIGGHTYEQGFSGYDFELGLPIFSFSEELDKKIGTKVFAAHYNFSAKGAPKIKGTRFRLEQPLGSFDIGDNELRLSLNAETQKDKIRGRQTSVGLSAKLLFNSSKEDYSFRSRMLDTIIRDVDIVTNFEKAADTIGSLTDKATGRKIDQVIYVGNADDNYIGDGTKESPYSFSQIAVMNIYSSIIIPTKVKPDKGGKPLTAEQHNILAQNPLALTSGKKLDLKSTENASTKIVLDADPLKGITMTSTVAVVKADTNEKVGVKKTEITSTSSIVDKIISEATNNENSAMLVDPIESMENQASIGKDNFIEIKSDKEFVEEAFKHTDVKLEDVKNYINEVAPNLSPEISKTLDRGEEIRAEEQQRQRAEEQRQRAEDARVARENEERDRLASEQRQRDEDARVARENEERDRLAAEEQQRQRDRLAAEEQRQRDEAARVAEEQRRNNQNQPQPEETEEQRQIREALDRIGDPNQRAIAREMMNNYRFTIEQAIALSAQTEEIRGAAIERFRNANGGVTVEQAIEFAGVEINNRRAAAAADEAERNMVAARERAERDRVAAEQREQQRQREQAEAAERDRVAAREQAERDRVAAAGGGAVVDRDNQIRELGVSEEQIQDILNTDEKKDKFLNIYTNNRDLFNGRANLNDALTIARSNANPEHFFKILNANPTINVTKINIVFRGIEGNNRIQTTQQHYANAVKIINECRGINISVSSQQIANLAKKDDLNIERLIGVYAQSNGNMLLTSRIASLEEPRFTIWNQLKTSGVSSETAFDVAKIDNEGLRNQAIDILDRNPNADNIDSLLVISGIEENQMPANPEYTSRELFGEFIQRDNAVAGDVALERNFENPFYVLTNDEYNELSPSDKALAKLIKDIKNLRIDVDNPANANNPYVKRYKEYKRAKEIYAEFLEKNPVIAETKDELEKFGRMGSFTSVYPGRTIQEIKDTWQENMVSKNINFRDDDDQDAILNHLIKINSGQYNSLKPISEHDPNAAEAIGQADGSSVKDRTIGSSYGRLYDYYSDNGGFAIDGKKAGEIITDIIAAQIKATGKQPKEFDREDNDSAVGEVNQDDPRYDKLQKAYRGIKKTTKNDFDFVDKVEGRIHYDDLLGLTLLGLVDAREIDRNQNGINNTQIFDEQKSRFGALAQALSDSQRIHNLDGSRSGEGLAINQDDRKKDNPSCNHGFFNRVAESITVGAHKIVDIRESVAVGQATDQMTIYAKKVYDNYTEGDFKEQLTEQGKVVAAIGGELTHTYNEDKISITKIGQHDVVDNKINVYGKSIDMSTYNTYFNDVMKSINKDYAIFNPRAKLMDKSMFDNAIKNAYSFPHFD